MPSLSARSEFVVVVAVAFGYFIYVSLLTVLAPATSSLAQAPITDAGLRWLVIHEVTVTALLATWLWTRGWRFAELGLGFAGRDLLPAVLLTLGAYATYQVVVVAGEIAWTGFAASSDGLASGAITLAAALAVSIVNPIFEEVFVCAYVIRALQRTRSTAFAVNVSVAIRVAYHLYQGAAGAITIIPLGLMFGWWFARTGRLWPVILAHAVLDLVGLLALNETWR